MGSSFLDSGCLPPEIYDKVFGFLDTKGPGRHDAGFEEHE